MKLYTEEQVKEMIDEAHNGVDGYYDIFKKHTPIELPSDEEIKQSAKDYHHNNGVYYGQVKAFIDSAKWVIDKIKNQQQ